MTALYSFNMTVEVDDVDVLFVSAYKHLTEVDGLKPDEAKEFLLVDGEIQVGECLTALFDPGHGPAGTTIVTSEALHLTEYQ